jgi:hypothetical protein
LAFFPHTDSSNVDESGVSSGVDRHVPFSAGAVVPDGCCANNNVVTTNTAKDMMASEGCPPISKSKHMGHADFKVSVRELWDLGIGESEVRDTGATCMIHRQMER